MKTIEYDLLNGRASPVFKDLSRTIFEVRFSGELVIRNAVLHVQTFVDIKNCLPKISSLILHNCIIDPSEVGRVFLRADFGRMEFHNCSRYYDPEIDFIAIFYENNNYFKTVSTNSPKGTGETSSISAHKMKFEPSIKAVPFPKKGEPVKHCCLTHGQCICNKLPWG